MSYPEDGTERLLKRIEQALYDLARRSDTGASQPVVVQPAQPSITSFVRLEEPIETIVTNTATVTGAVSVSPASPIRYGVLDIAVGGTGLIRPATGSDEQWELRALYVSGACAVHRIYGTDPSDRYDDVFVFTALGKEIGLALLVSEDYYFEVENTDLTAVRIVYEAVNLTL